MAKTIISGRSKAITGVREMQARIADLVSAMDGDERTAARQSLRQILYDASEVIRDQARANASAQGVPAEVVSSIFAYSDSDRFVRGKSSALAGVNKRRTMRVWITRGRSKSPRAKVTAGGKVGMSLSTMYEFGTSKMRARPFFRPAVTATRARVIETVRSGLGQMIADIARSPT